MFNYFLKNFLHSLFLNKEQKEKKILKPISKFNSSQIEIRLVFQFCVDRWNWNFRRGNNWHNILLKKKCKICYLSEKKYLRIQHFKEYLGVVFLLSLFTRCSSISLQLFRFSMQTINVVIHTLLVTSAVLITYFFIYTLEEIIKLIFVKENVSEEKK